MRFQRQKGLNLVVASSSTSQIPNSSWPYAVDSNGDISVIHFPDSSAMPIAANNSSNSDIEIIQTIGMYIEILYFFTIVALSARG